VGASCRSLGSSCFTIPNGSAPTEARVCQTNPMLPTLPTNKTPSFILGLAKYLQIRCAARGMPGRGAAPEVTRGPLAHLLCS